MKYNLPKTSYANEDVSVTSANNFRTVKKGDSPQYESRKITTTEQNTRTVIIDEPTCSRCNSDAFQTEQEEEEWRELSTYKLTKARTANIKYSLKNHLQQLSSEQISYGPRTTTTTTITVKPKITLTVTRKSSVDMKNFKEKSVGIQSTIESKTRRVTNQ